MGSTFCFIKTLGDTSTKPISVWQANLSAADFAFYKANAGLYARPQVVGPANTLINVTTLTASDGTVLATGLITDLQWETAWNSLGVPYERRQPLPSPANTRYIKNLAQFGEIAGFFRQSTLKFDGTGL